MCLPIRVLLVVLCMARFGGAGLLILEVGVELPSATPRRSRQDICRRRVCCHLVTDHGRLASRPDLVDLQANRLLEGRLLEFR